MNISTVFLFILYCISKEIIKANQAWLYIANVLKHDTKINQLLLLYENNIISTGIFQISKNISRTIPIQVVDFIKIREEKKHKLPIPEYLIQTTTIVIIPSQNNYGNSSNLFNVLKIIAELSHPKTRPKILIVTQVTRQTKYEEFFKLLWYKQFLDVTILQLKMQQNNCILKQCIEPKIVNLHYYNPFTESFYKKIFSKNSILFPQKLRDMNGYKITVGLFHYPPYVFTNRNSNGELNVHGPDVNLMEFFSNAMNFNLEKKIYNLTNWTPINCTKEYNSGGSRDLIYNDIQLTAIQSAMIRTCFSKFTLSSRGTRMLNFIFLVPILPNEEQLLSTEWNLMNVIGIICLILMPWLIGKSCKFDRQQWQLMYVIQMILGMSIPQEPKKSLERIVFLIMMFFFFIQSSYVFTTFSSLQLQKTTFRKMETLEDLLAANLTIIIHGNGQINKENKDNDTYQLLMKNAIYSKESLEKCAQILMDYRNISCNGREDIARLIIQKIKNTNKQERIKILKEVGQVRPSGLYHAGGSPFTRQIEFVTSILIESGISEKWDTKYIPKVLFQENQSEMFNQESSLISKGLHLTIVLLLVGFSFSCLILAVEIMIHKCLNR